MRVIGLDVHRSFAEVAVLDKGIIEHAGRFKLEHHRVIDFGKSLRRSDEVVLEATGNTSVIVRLLTPFVRRVVVAKPLQVRAIAWAKAKTDKVDASVLAKLHASGFLPEVWIPNEDIEALRRRIAERNQLVSQMTRLKNRVHSVLYANLIPRYAGKLFSKRGRTWLDTQPLPEDQRRQIGRHLDEHDRIAIELVALEKHLAENALRDDRVRRLMTIGGVNAIVALGVLAAIGDVARFSSPQKLSAISASIPRCGSLVTGPPITVASAGRAAPTLALCWSRRHGQSRPSPGRYEHSSTASSSDAASRSPLSRLLASWRF
jgi:transposase